MALLAQASPGGLGLASDLNFAYPPHLELIDREVVEAVARAQLRQRMAEAGQPVDDRPEILLVEVPPRHGKSTLISEHTPAWFLGTFPERRVILASYEADFAGTWGLKARRILEDHGHELYGVGVSKASKAAKRWDLDGHKGGMVTAGVGGPITGKGAHLLIIDDPIKNAEQAMSEVIREKHWDWWLSTARTRLEPGAVVVILLTRWHEGDLAGRMLKDSEEGGDPVREIRLPALAEQEDLLGRAPGEAIWPERYTTRYLEHTRKVLGAYWFSAMYQGSPTPDEGGIFNRRDFRYFVVDDANELVRLYDKDGSELASYGTAWCRKVQYSDLASSEKETADYTVCTEVWVTPNNDMLIHDVVRERIAGPDQPDFFRNHHIGGPMKFEAIGYQSTLVQTMLREGFPAEAVFPDRDKVTRASSAGVLYRQAKVFHRRGAPWLNDFEHELLAFPAGEHDDQVDTIAYAAKDLPSVTTQTGVKQKSKGRTMTGGLASREL